MAKETQALQACKANHSCNLQAKNNTMLSEHLFFF
jgi:hypothetical protein